MNNNTFYAIYNQRSNWKKYDKMHIGLIMFYWRPKKNAKTLILFFMQNVIDFHNGYEM